jgi:cytoplasmic iron level regulating protein YaaA (DUF328/UPF0246 family)
VLTLISPAKTLDFESKFNLKNCTLPIFRKEIEILLKALKKAQISDLEKNFNISKNLAELNFLRFQNFSKEFNEANSRPALIAFDGDVYDGIDKKNFKQEDFDFAQNNLRILSGLYGILRPLDLIQPYRLEMGTNFLKFDKKIKNLYEFWSNKISQELNLEDSSYIINLASEEYFLAVDRKNIKAKIIDISFKNKKDGKLKVIGINSKKARGLMANFIIKNRITDPKKLKSFNQNGYKFDDKLSSDSCLVFTD